MPDYADTAAIRFERAIAAMQTRVGELYASLRHLPAEEIMAELLALDLRTVVTGLLEPELARLQATYAAGLELIAPGGTVSGEVLDALLDMDMQVYIGRIGATGEELQRLIARSALTGMAEKDFAAQVLKTGLQPYQANALANDSLRKYQRQVRHEMAKSAPDDALYIYQGPVDGRVRDDCMTMLEAGPLTRAEIESNFPGAFTAGGGFNCRHEWMPYVRARQYKETAIKSEFASREAA